MLSKILAHVCDVCKINCIVNNVHEDQRILINTFISVIIACSCFLTKCYTCNCIMYNWGALCPFSHCVSYEPSITKMYFLIITTGNHVPWISHPPRYSVIPWPVPARPSPQHTQDWLHNQDSLGVTHNTHYLRKSLRYNENTFYNELWLH